MKCDTQKTIETAQWFSLILCKSYNISSHDRPGLQEWRNRNEKVSIDRVIDQRHS